MKNDDSNVKFVKLTEDEKISKLIQLTKEASYSLRVWIKAKNTKFNLVPIGLVDQNLIEVSSELPLDEAEYLVNFVLKGLNFFTQTNIKKISEKKYILKMDFDIFKSERRANFRLLTYPHQKVFLSIKTNAGEVSEANVLDMKTKVSSVDLFKNFLSLVEDNDQEASKKSYTKFRVADISVTGMAIHLSEYESDFFSTFVDKALFDLRLDFNGKLINIPKAQILYKVDLALGDKSNRMYKAGIQFLDLDINLDETLSSIINKTLRSVESEFEGFIK